MTDNLIIIVGLMWVGGFLIGFGLRGILEYIKNKHIKGYNSNKLKQLGDK